MVLQRSRDRKQQRNGDVACRISTRRICVVMTVDVVGFEFRMSEASIDVENDVAKYSR